MENINELISQREQILAQMRTALAAENYEEFDRLSAQEDSLAQKIVRYQRMNKAAEEEAARWLEQQERSGRQPSASEQHDYWSVFRRSLISPSSLTPEERAFLAAGGEKRAIATSPATAGGYLVAPEYWREIVVRLKDYAPVFDFARVINTTTGADFSMPFFDGTSLIATIVAEEGAIAPTALSFGTVSLKAYKYAAMLTVTWEMLQDSAFDIQAFMRERLAEMFGRALNAHFTTGTGTNQPQGVVTGATLGHTTAANNAITRAEILQLLHSVDPAYRRSPNAAFMLSDEMLRVLKALQLGSNDASPLWVPSMREGEPDRIEGYPYIINQAMDNLGPNKNIMLFGDFSRYVIRSVKDVTYQPLLELFAANGVVGLVAHARYDARVVDNQAIKVLKTPA